MTSAFDAPSGPAASIPPPPPGAVPPPPPPSGGATPPAPPTPVPPTPTPAPASAQPGSVPPPPPTSTPSSVASATAASPATPAPAEQQRPPTSGFEQTEAQIAESADDRHDLTDLLDRLHEDLDVEPSGALVDANAPLTDPRDLDRPTERDAVVIESTGGIDFRPDFASLGARIIGVLVDGVALSAAMIPGAAMMLQTTGTANTLIGLLLLFVGFFAVNVWYARSVAASGQWLGNRVAKTKVVDVVDGSNIDVAHAGARFVARHLISVIFLVGFVVALTDSQRRTFHDRIGGSVVIGRPRATWTAGGTSE